MTAWAGPNLATDGIQGLAELHSVGTPRPGWTRLGVPVCRRVEEHDPVARGNQGLDVRRELGAAPAPPVHEVDDRTLAPHVAADRCAERLDNERVGARAATVPRPGSAAR